MSTAEVSENPASVKRVHTLGLLGAPRTAQTAALANAPHDMNLATRLESASTDVQPAGTSCGSSDPAELTIAIECR